MINSLCNKLEKQSSKILECDHYKEIEPELIKHGINPIQSFELIESSG